MQVFKLQSIIGQYSFQVFHNLYCHAAWVILKINILQSTNSKRRSAKFVRRKNSFNRRFIFRKLRNAVCIRFFPKAKDKQIGD